MKYSKKQSGSLMKYVQNFLIKLSATADIEERLNKAKAPESVASRNRIPPLHIFALQRDVQAVKLLVARGANVDLKVPQETSTLARTGETPLHFAAFGSVHEENGEKNRADLIRFLVARGANVDALAPLDGDATPLMLALAANQTEAAKVLISCGANVNCHANTGDSVLDLAKQKCPDIVELLISRGAESSGQREIYSGLDILPGDMMKWPDSILGEYVIRKFKNLGVTKESVTDFLLDQGEEGRQTLIAEWRTSQSRKVTGTDS